MIAERLAAVESRISAACARAGRPRQSVTLIAVSKTVPAAVVAEAAACGQLIFGESYAQEGKKKIEELEKLLAAKPPPGPLSFHFIGALQRNKVKHAVGLFKLIHSVDRPELADEIAKTAARMGIVQELLVQINVSGEASKSGVPPDAAENLCGHVVRLPNVVLRGLMAIGTFDASDALRRGEFRLLADLRARLEQRMSIRLEHLSMGMSDDFESAIKEGASIIRVGTAIFGERPLHSYD